MLRDRDIPGPVAPEPPAPAQPGTGDGPSDAGATQPGRADARPGGADDRPAVAAGRPWWRALRAGLITTVLSHLAYFAVTAVAWLDTNRGPERDGLAAAWLGWDTGWLAAIAERGYDNADCAADTLCSYAYFPLYPALVHVTDLVTPGDARFAAGVLSTLIQPLALAVLYRLTESELDSGSARRTLWYLIAFPTGFFLAVGYNHGLFLLLAAGTLYAARQGRWWLAAALCALADATRFAGILLLLPLCWEYLRQHGRRIQLDALSLLLAPAGLAAFAFYSWRRVGDPLAFSHAQASWGRHLSPPWTGFQLTVQEMLARPYVGTWSGHALLDLGCLTAVAVLLVLAFVGPWRLRRDQWALPAYGVAIWLLIVVVPSTGTPTATLPLYSSARLALEAFPAFLVLARAGGRHEWIDRGYLVIALLVQGVLLTHYLSNAFVA